MRSRGVFYVAAIFSLLIIFTFHALKSSNVVSIPTVKLGSIFPSDVALGTIGGVGDSNINASSVVLSASAPPRPSVVSDGFGLTPLPDTLSNYNMLPLSSDNSEVMLVDTASEANSSDISNLSSNDMGELVDKSVGVLLRAKADDVFYKEDGLHKKDISVTGGVGSILPSTASNYTITPNINIHNKKVEPRTSNIWKIIGAKPGSAVLHSSTTRETRSVEVGNSIVGIGKIMSIAKVNGKWVIVGTIENISQ